MKKTKRAMSLFLVFYLLFTFSVPAQGTAPKAVHIRSAEDLREFSKNCALDSWSKGLIVHLDTDLDLSGQDFSPVPTFGGTFYGNGHTISGFLLSSGGGAQGFFRYVQEDAAIISLKVEGTVAPSELSDRTGGIAGVNLGRITNCSFSGTVDGKENTGGIAGVNSDTGQIINCSFFGTLDGVHGTGGIAGQNFGSIIQCQNWGEVNTGVLEAELSVPDWDEVNSLDNVPAATDTGGIAGYSSGVIQSCRNEGTVGHAHMGYNVGGIAGRQCGYLDSCVNNGSVQGRKDVGGIVGQLEPQMTLQYSADTLDRLMDELSVLGELTDKAMGDANSSAQVLSDQLSYLTDQLQSVKDSTGAVMSAVGGLADAGLSTINDISARIAWILEQAAPAVETCGEAFSTLKQSIQTLQELWESGSGASGLDEAARRKASEALDALKQSMESSGQALESIGSALDDLKRSLGDESATAQAFQKIADGIALLQSSQAEAVQALRDLADALDTAQEQPEWNEIASALRALSDALEDGTAALDSMGSVLREITQNGPTENSLRLLGASAMELVQAMEDMRSAGKALGTAAKKLQDGQSPELAQALAGVVEALVMFSDAGEKLSQVIAELAEQPAIEFQRPDSSLTEKTGALSAALDGLLRSADGLSVLLGSSSNTLTSDMEAIQDQISLILTLLRDGMSEQQTQDPSQWFEDVSDQEDTRQEEPGKISGCRNNGPIGGDVNVAGIAGSMAVEVDFDPEDDLLKSGDRSLNFRYLARAVLYNCVNSGEITGKKDNSGGIVGRMDLGRVSACENYGSVASTAGGYVGGIAGTSSSVIRDCWSKCCLTGGSYVGGIAGFGTNIQRCRSIVSVSQVTDYTGAIAGSVSENGTLTENLFVSDNLSGVDGVSYAQRAEPVSVTEIMTQAPEEFKKFTLTFRADGKTVQIAEFAYGGGLSQLPEVPEKDGYVGQWPDADYSRLTQSMTIDAEYIPYSSSLSSEGGACQVLAEGTFSTQAEMTVAETTESWTKGGKKYEGTVRTVTVRDPCLETGSYTLHVRLPEGTKDVTLWLKTETGWETGDYTKDGNYILFPCLGEKTVFCLLPRSGAVWGFIGGAAVLAAAGLLLLLRKRKKAPKKEESSSPA